MSHFGINTKIQTPRVNFVTLTARLVVIGSYRSKIFIKMKFLHLSPPPLICSPSSEEYEIISKSGLL